MSYVLEAHGESCERYLKEEKKSLDKIYYYFFVQCVNNYESI